MRHNADVSLITIITAELGCEYSFWGVSTKFVVEESQDNKDEIDLKS
jgi:hypothetical protein